MTQPIGPGDYVECLMSHRNGRVRAGAIYTVAAVLPAPGVRRCPCHGHVNERLRVHEAPNSHPAKGWCIELFRPIYRPKESLFEKLLELITEKEDA